MADYVLVHGAWHGAWCWKRVLPTLWQAGHRAFAVSLGGVGERAHEAAETIGLARHIDDVCAVIDAEELQQAVLVGHSYAGMVITGVADRLGDRLAHLVYLDAMLPRPHESWSSLAPPGMRDERRRLIAREGTLPPPNPTLYGLSGADAAWVSRRQTRHPGRPYDEPLGFDPATLQSLPRTYVSCTQPPLSSVDLSRARARSEPGWNFIELATGHDPMISAAPALAAILLRLG